MIPRDLNRRVAEAEVDHLIEEHLKAGGGVAAYLFESAFGGHMRVHRIVKTAKNVHADQRVSSGDVLDFGENDIEAFAEMLSPDGTITSIALFIENKVDAPMMPDQGLRYRTRAARRLALGEFADYRCAFVAPKKKIQQTYPLGDHVAAGWHRVFSFEEISEKLASVGQVEDAQFLLDATLSLNHVPRPIEKAVRFWNDYEQYARATHGDVPVPINSQVGSRIGGVWPSFFEDRFRRTVSRQHQWHRFELVM